VHEDDRQAANRHPDPGSGSAREQPDPAAAARRRILMALQDLDHDRPELLAAFARAALRRVP
jgi:hypothetical protein